MATGTCSGHDRRAAHESGGLGREGGSMVRSGQLNATPRGATQAVWCLAGSLCQCFSGSGIAAAAPSGLLSSAETAIQKR